jgi:hypothetical protein
MKFYEATAQIAAPPEAIWAILVDAPGLSQFDSGIERVDGRIAAGETITVYSKASTGRAFPVKVVAFTPNRSMRWSGGMPLGLFKGERTFTLVPRADGTTELAVREEYSGPLLGMMWRSMPDLQPSFDQFVRGVKQRAEQPQPA